MTLYISAYSCYNETMSLWWCV